MRIKIILILALGLQLYAHSGGIPPDSFRDHQSKTQSETWATNKQESPLSIKASPNPASHYVEFTYELSEIDKEGVILITDINGKLIQNFVVKYNKGVQAWDIRKIPAGAYIFTLKTKYFEESGKLIIK